MGQVTPHQARQLLDQAGQAYRDSSRPTQSAIAHGVCAALAGVGVALLAQLPEHRPGHLLVMLGGLVLIALAAYLPTRARRRAGLRGYQGITSTDNLVGVLTVVVLVICALNGTATTAVVYAILGALTAIAYFMVLRNHPWMAR